MTEELGRDIRVGHVVKNLLAKKIFMECSRITMKRCFGLGRAIEMFPRLGRHGSAGDLAQFAKTHPVKWFFDHRFLMERGNFPAVSRGISQVKRSRAVTFLERKQLTHAQLFTRLREAAVCFLHLIPEFDDQSIAEVG